MHSGFHAADVRLVVELDGGIHDRQGTREHDIVREDYLRLRQRVVIRFTNDEVLNSLDSVLERLRIKINELAKSDPNP